MMFLLHVQEATMKAHLDTRAKNMHDKAVAGRTQSSVWLRMSNANVEHLVQKWTQVRKVWSDSEKVLIVKSHP